MDTLHYEQLENDYSTLKIPLTNNDKITSIYLSAYNLIKKNNRITGTYRRYQINTDTYFEDTEGFTTLHIDFNLEDDLNKELKNLEPGSIYTGSFILEVHNNGGRITNESKFLDVKLEVGNDKNISVTIKESRQPTL